MDLHTNLYFDFDDKVIAPLYVSFLYKALNIHKVSTLACVQKHLQQSNGDKLSLRELIALLEEALPEKHTGLGYDFGRRLSLVALDAFGQLIMSCKDLNEALHHMQRFRLFLVMPVQIGLHEQSSLPAQLGATPQGQEPIIQSLSIKGLYSETHSVKVTQFISEALYSCILHQCRWLTGEELNYSALCFPCSSNTTPSTKAALVQSYKKLFGCEIRFHNKPHQIAFSQRYLTLPLLSANECIKRKKLESCERALARWQHKFTLSQRIIAMFNKTAPNFPTSEEAADALHISKSCLYRKLQEQNTSYQELLSEFKRKRAESMLTTTTMTVSQISEALGFSDSSTFRRAFKAWTGLQPSSVRETAQTISERAFELA